MIFEALFAVAITAAGYGLWRRRARSKRRRQRMSDPAFRRRQRGRRAEAELLKMARGDPAHVERLIAAERRRRPDGDRAQWAIAAHKRWLADLR